MSRTALDRWLPRILSDAPRASARPNLSYRLWLDNLESREVPAVGMRMWSEERRLGTIECPVLFEPPEAADLVGAFVHAVSGGSLYRRASFLLDSAGTQVFAPHITIREEPHIPRARGSTPFDNEGVATAPRDVVRDGVVQGYFMGSYSARKLGLASTGNAGGAHNLVVTPGPDDLPAMLRRLGRGLFVTDLQRQAPV